VRHGPLHLPVLRAFSKNPVKSTMTRDETRKRQAIIDACRRMNALGINQGTSGNISVRYGDGLLITPTSVPYEAMTPEQIVFMGLEIPPIHYMIAVAGGDSIRCAPYATYGTPELSAHALKALEDRQACLLDHHGMIAIGPSLAKAMWLAVEVETLARQYHGCLQIGRPPLLPKDEIERVRLKMAGYGHADA
jgi:L-fuculose-phosphate aldolase